MNELTNYLLNYALNHGVGFKIAEFPADFEPLYLPDLRLIVINRGQMPSAVFPFKLAHEIGHALATSSPIDVALYTTSPANRIKLEAVATKKARAILQEYCAVTGVSFATIPIPRKMA